MSTALRLTTVASRTVLNGNASLPVARTVTRQMSAHHGPPDPWPKNQKELNKLHGYGLALMGISAFIGYKIGYSS